MTKRHLFIILILTVTLFASLPVLAEDEAVTSSFIGSWMLDKVYENSSSADRFILDPESSASVYGEKDNIYVFLADGAAEMTMVGETMDGCWEKEDEDLLLIISSTTHSPDKNSELKPDIDPPYEMTFFFDEEQDVLHRYWKDSNPDATYHDLDFVYRRMPEEISAGIIAEENN